MASEKVMLIFAESLNDAKAIAELVVGLCPKLKGRVKPLPQPVSLTRTAQPNKAKRWFARVAEAVAAYERRGGSVLCLIVHRDADVPDETMTMVDEIKSGLRAAGVETGYAVVPTEEIEAWWFLFPAALEAAVPGWQHALPTRAGDVDRLQDPKERLILLTKKKLPRRPYSEADSPLVAAKVRELGLSLNPAGRSASYEHFRGIVMTCCPG